MKNYGIETLKQATFLRGYFFDKELPKAVREALESLCDGSEAIIGDMNQMMQAHDALTEERHEIRIEPFSLDIGKPFDVGAGKTEPFILIREEPEKHITVAAPDATASLSISTPHTGVYTKEMHVEADKAFTQKGHPNYSKGNPENVWEPWQDELLTKMKLSANPEDKITANIAKAVGKTATQVHNRWYKIGKAHRNERFVALPATPGRHDQEQKKPQPVMVPSRTIKPPREDTPAERLITAHNEFAGRRYPKLELQDSDWADIKDMLDKKRMSTRLCADAYDVDFDTMLAFITRNRAIDAGEAQHKGEARRW